MSVFKFGTLKSPPRRPTVQGSAQSPFCTSPSQLQEVTLDQGSSGNEATVPFTLSLQSPGKTSPILGRTVKEYEEQLTQLKKENFNLKLRIYFLDERMGQMNMNSVDGTDHTKEDCGLKLTYSSLQKELLIKQDLVVQASRAIDVLEEQYRSELKKLKEEHDTEKSILNSHIQELEHELKIFKNQAKEQKFVNLKSTGDIHSQEETEWLKQQIADLTSQVETMKVQQKCRSDSSRDQLADDDLSPSQHQGYSTQASTAEEMSSPGRRTHLNSDVSLKEKQLKIMEESKKEDSLGYETMQLQIKELELQLTETKNKLRESEELRKKLECQFNQTDKERLKAYQAIKGFMKKNTDLSCELEQLKLEMKKKDHRVHDLTSELKELRDACNKANWEACQLQAQACIQGSCGKPGTFEDVRDMTEEENERLWAELEDKNKKLAEVTTQRDNLSTEMAKQVQNLVTALQDKKSSLKERERMNAALSSELETREKHIKKLNEELIEVKMKLKVIEKDLQEKSRAEIQDKKDNEEKQEKIENLELALEDKKKEVEHLNIELGKRNGNLQELLNKELRDKNKEIECLPEGGTKKQMEVMLLEQKLDARAFQLQLLQEKVTELGVQVSLPTSLVLREKQQQVGTYFAQHMQMAGDAEPKLQEQLQASWEDRKYLCQKVEELQEQLRNTPERDSDSRALRTECIRLREELQKADSWRRDATEVCSKLTQRLEELSMFLAALLKHPEQLNGLSVKRRLMLSQAVERSMEMSRSLSVTLSATNQEFNETTVPLVNDSASSIFMASDLNISELFKESSDNVEITGIDEENRALEMHVEGNNTENVSAKILEHADPVNNLQLQVETQQEVKQDNKEKEVLQKIANKILLVSADSVQKSETEDNNSLSSMTFYNSRIVGNSCGGDAVVLSEDKGPGSSSPSDSDMIELSNQFTAPCQNIRLEMQPKHSQPGPGSDIIELSNRFTASCQTLTPLKLSPPKKVTKAACVNKMRRSSSASAVPLSQVVPAVSKKEQGVAGSLSDSEAWSEPDRTVSLARIGLNEEATNIVVSPGANNNMDVGASCRKIIQVEDSSSDTSEETTREIIRNPGKRARIEAAEIKRLQSRLQMLEHFNEVLKAELSIMHQLMPHGNKSVLVCNQNMSAVCAVSVDNSANVLKSPSKDSGTNANQSVSINEIETKESKHKVELKEKNVNTSPAMNKSNMDSSTSTEGPLDLLDQIKFQREKLESSLYHNNVIRHHLENIFHSPNSKEDNVTSDACRWIKETAEQLEEAQQKCLRQQYHVEELNLQLAQSVKQTKLANEELQVTQNAVRSFQEHINSLEALLKEKDSKLSDQQCLINEIDSACKEKSLELEKMMHEKRRLREQLQEIQRLKKESDAKLQKALSIQEDARIKLAEMEIELSDYKMLVEHHNLEKVAYQKEKEQNIRKLERMLREVSDQKDDVEFQNREVKKRMQKAELQKLEAERMMMKMQHVAEKFKEECKIHVETAIEKEKRDLEMQLNRKLCDEQQKLEDRHRKEIEAKISDYEAKIKQQEKEIWNKAEDKIKALEEEHKKIVIDLKKQMQEREKLVNAKEIELKKRLDEAILSNSKITLEKTRMANEKLHLEKELLKQEAFKFDLLYKRKEAENSLSALKEKMEKEVSSVHELSRDKRRLEAIVKDLEAVNDELMKRLCASHSENLHTGNEGDAISGSESTPSKALSSASPRSFSSGLDGGSTGPVSLETNISLGDDRNFGPGSLFTLPHVIVQQKGMDRQRSETSDNMSEDQPLEGYIAVFSQMKKSEMDVRTAWVTEQHSTPSSSNARNLTSPDLGIESDHGRFSSLEASSSAPPENHQSEAVDIHTNDIGARDCKKLEQENVVLKQRLYKTRRALEQTAMRLTVANRRKKEVERAICKQLHKTQRILKQTRVNLESKAEEAEEYTK